MNEYLKIFKMQWLGSFLMDDYHGGIAHIISKQCGTKGDCQVGYLRNRHILIRFNLLEDFVNILSKSVLFQ